MTPLEIYECLYTCYGDLQWWPARTPYEVMVGAILTQNTAWHNVEKAIARFAALSPAFVEHAEMPALIDIIRPAGFFNQKAVYLKALTAWYKRYGYSVETVQGQDMAVLRRELLAVRGVGRETADSVLLYAFGFPSFVVDAYTLRLLERLGINVDAGGIVTKKQQKKPGYENVKAYFEQNLPQAVYIYNNFHACIVIHGKEHCRAKPVCGGCPLREACEFL